MRRQIPNIVTLLNLLAGCIAITMAFQHNFTGVVIWVITAAIFDFLDGFTARLLGVSSDLGIQLDSLSDLVSFGVAPASAVYIFLLHYIKVPAALAPFLPYIAYSAFLLALFSAYRLAKFNIDERQTTSFLGLPTPANGMFWVSMVYGLYETAANNEIYFFATLLFIIALSLLMVSEVPMFSLKIKKIQWKGNEMQLILLVLGIIFVVLWGITGIAATMLAYILLSLATGIRKKKLVN